MQLRPYSKPREILGEATIAAAENGQMATLTYLLQIAPEGELNERAFLNAVQRGHVAIAQSMADWYGIEYTDIIDRAFEVADPRNDAMIQFLIALEHSFVEGEEEEYEETTDYDQDRMNNVFIRQALNSIAVNRPIVSTDVDERTDAITATEIRRNSEYIICANPQRPHPYAIQSYFTWCRSSSNCLICPQCRLPMIPQRYLNKQDYRMTRRWR